MRGLRRWWIGGLVDSAGCVDGSSCLAVVARFRLSWVRDGRATRLWVGSLPNNHVTPWLQPCQVRLARACI